MTFHNTTVTASYNGCCDPVTNPLRYSLVGTTSGGSVGISIIDHVVPPTITSGSIVYDSGEVAEGITLTYTVKDCLNNTETSTITLSRAKFA